MKGSRRPPLSPPLGVVAIAIAVMMLTAVVTIAAVAVAVMPALPAAAQGDGITISDSGVANRFPDGLHFHIDAASAVSPIKEIRVYVQKPGPTSPSDYRTMELEPETGNAVSGEVLFESRIAGEYIPPGARLSYHFEIRTEDGQTHDTEPETTVYLNRGLEWQQPLSDCISLPHGCINVYYYPLGSDRAGAAGNRAQSVLQVASDTYKLMQPILGVDLKEPMNIVVYSDYDDMRAGLRPSSRVAAQHLRTLGQAFSSYRVLLVDGSADFFIGDNTLTTAAHEFTHLLVADAAGSPNTRVHTWLNEGLAVYSERAARPGQNEDSEFDYYLEQAIRNDAVPPLTSLYNFTGTPQETLLYYGIGHAVVSYMLGKTHGEEKMAALFQAIRDPKLRNTEKALSAAYGLTIHELDNEWRRSEGLPERAETTPAPPPLQVIPTPRPPPTPTAAVAPATSAGATATPTPTGVAPTNMPAPTYTPYPHPLPTQASAISAVANGAEDAGLPPGPRASGGGCAAPLPASSEGGAGAGVVELAAAGLLAGPVGLLALVAWRRRRSG